MSKVGIVSHIEQLAVDTRQLLRASLHPLITALILLLRFGLLAGKMSTPRRIGEAHISPLVADDARGASLALARSERHAHGGGLHIQFP